MRKRRLPGLSLRGGRHRDGRAALDALKQNETPKKRFKRFVLRAALRPAGLLHFPRVFLIFEINLRVIVAVSRQYPSQTDSRLSGKALCKFLVGVRDEVQSQMVHKVKCTFPYRCASAIPDEKRINLPRFVEHLQHYNNKRLYNHIYKITTPYIYNNKHIYNIYEITTPNIYNNIYKITTPNIYNNKHIYKITSNIYNKLIYKITTPNVFTTTNAFTTTFIK